MEESNHYKTFIDLEEFYNPYVQDMAIEKFSANTTQIGHTLRNLCERLQETEYPNDVTSTEALILSHESERAEVKEDIRTTLRHGEILLGCFKSVRQADGPEEVESASLPACKLAHVTAVERLLVQLEETEHNFDDFWYRHEKRLQQCLQLRKFEEDFKQMQYLVSRQVQTLGEMTEMADSISRVETLLRELVDFEKESESDVVKGEAVQQMGEKLIQEDHYAVDCIRPKCMELQQMCMQYREMVRSRYEVLHRSRDLQERIAKANKWCSRGMELLSSDDLEGYETLEEAEAALQETQEFLETADELRLNNPKEFRQMFDSMITPETRGVVQDLLKRIEDIQALCEKRVTDLKVVVENAQPAEPEPEPEPEPVSLVPPQVERSESPVSDSDRKRKKSLTPNIGKKTNSTDKLQKMRVEIIRTDGDLSDNSVTSLEEVEAATRDIPIISSDSDLMHAKRGHVMRELIDTERIYVTELTDILTGYLQEMGNPEMDQLIPEALKGRENVLFGNLEKILEFHEKTFLKDLENCRHTPHAVGRCFVSRDEEFQIYSYYCQNKPNSEALRKEIGDSNLFFKECQKKLQHRLPLSAYLLKPIQRITKYQLLIKEMLKYTDDEASAGELKDALKTMLGVLKYVNDIMHQVAITGFPGKLSELGRLLMQGPFNVWQHKKEKIKDLRFKPMQRHVFLYEKRILFCKKKEDPQNVDKSYMYKSSIETADIGMTENVKGDKRKFELWLNGRAQVYTIQAESMDQKSLWVQEIKKVLMSQFDMLKKAREKPVTPIASSQLQSSQSFDNAANNNNPMIHLGYSFSSTTDDSVGSGSVDYAEDYSSDEFDESSADTVSMDHTLVYISLAEYNPVEVGEIRLAKGDYVRVLQEGLEGWWYVRRLSNKDEGWAPASYLDSAKRLSSLSAVSVSSNDSDGDRGFINLRNTASRSSTNSAISTGSHGEETLV